MESKKDEYLDQQIILSTVSTSTELSDELSLPLEIELGMEVEELDFVATKLENVPVPVPSAQTEDCNFENALDEVFMQTETETETETEIVGNHQSRHKVKEMDFDIEIPNPEPDLENKEAALTTSASASESSGSQNKCESAATASVGTGTGTGISSTSGSASGSGSGSGAGIDSIISEVSDMDKNKENVNILEAMDPGPGPDISIDLLTEIDGVENTANNSSANKKLLHAESQENRISVRERMQKFNNVSSETDLLAAGGGASGSGSGSGSGTGATVGKLSPGRFRREHLHKHESKDEDTSSVSSFGYGYASMQPRDREWIVKASQCDYMWLNKAAQENPELVKRKDINGYTALHWAAKHGHADLVKLLAGTFKSNINSKSNGGYTPLHLAAQFNRQDVYDILSTVYNADVNIRDHSGKKPRQYLVRQEASVEKMPVHMRLSSPSSSSSPTHVRLSQSLSNNSADLPNMFTVSLPTCNTSNRNSAELSSGGSSSSSTTSINKPVNPAIERTGMVTLTSFVNRSPSSISRTNSFRTTPSSSQGSLTDVKAVSRNHSFLGPFRNVDDMRKSFRQGVKKMWHGHPKYQHHPSSGSGSGPGPGPEPDRSTQENNNNIKK